MVFKKSSGFLDTYFTVADVSPLLLLNPSNMKWDLINGPKVSCDRAIRYAGFSGFRSGTVLLEISWILPSRSLTARPEKLPKPNRKGSSSNFQPPFFKGKLAVKLRGCSLFGTKQEKSANEICWEIPKSWVVGSVNKNLPWKRPGCFFV